MDRSGIVIAIVMIAAGCVSAASSIEDNKLGSVIGIYFGTSSYRVGVYVNGHFEIIPNDEGNHSTPSWVAFTDSETLIGEAAKNQAAVNPQRTIFDVKRLVGREFEDKEVQRVMKAVPYKIVNKDGKPYIKVGETKVFSPVEISAMILTKVKERAEAFLGKKITDAVVPVPSYFNDDQRDALMDACLIAGLNVLTVIEEQIAVAHAYGLHEETADKHILMFQLGEGAFDVTMLEIAYGGLFDYRATAHLGGEEYNERIMEYLIKLTKNKYGKEVSKDNRALRMEAKRAKMELSNQNQVLVNLFDDVFEPLRFEELNNELLTGLVKKAIEDARLEKHRIEDIILLGGNNNNNTLKVQQLLREYFNGRVEPKVSVNPDDLVVIGAAVAGDLLVREPDKDSMC